MTNKELQEYLKKFPDDAEILQETEDSYGWYYDAVKLTKDRLERYNNKDFYTGCGGNKRLKNAIVIGQPPPVQVEVEDYE